MTRGLVRANNFSDLTDKDQAVTNLGLSSVDYAALKGLYTTAGIDFAVIGEIGNSQGNYQAQLDGVSSTFSGIVLSGYVNRSGNSAITGNWSHSGIIDIVSGLPSGYPASTDSLFSLSIENGEAVIVASGLIASGLSYNGVRQSSSTVQRALPPSGFSPLHLIPLQVGGQGYFAEAGESPSFHIAPARLGHALDLVTGNLIGTYNSASPAMAVGSDGLLFTPAANAPVIEYNPVTRACLGTRIWGVVTNQIRNNTMVGAATGIPGTMPINWSDVPTSNGLSRQIVGIGTEAGITYIAIRYSGTTTATASTVLQPELSAVVVAATGQSWTASSWLALAGGSANGLTIVQRVTGRSSGGSFLENTDTTITPSSTLTRYAASKTMTNASTLRVSCDIVLSYNSGAAIDITLRIGLPQLEQSATMGPVVPTSGLIASSTADVWSITGADFNRIYNQSAVTFYFDGSYVQAGPSSFPRMIAAVGSNPNTDEVSIYGRVNTGSGDGRFYGSSTIAGTSQFTLGEFTSPVMNSGKAAAAFALNDAAMFDGQASTTDNTGTLPVAQELRIMGQARFQPMPNGYIRELAIFRSRRPNANLQALTT
jgi:hypothetical protein